MFQPAHRKPQVCDLFVFGCKPTACISGGALFLPSDNPYDFSNATLNSSRYLTILETQIFIFFGGKIRF